MKQMNPCRRKCWDCGNEADHEDRITPYVNCKKCGSQDTRLVKPIELQQQFQPGDRVTLDCTVRKAGICSADLFVTGDRDLEIEDIPFSYIRPADGWMGISTAPKDGDTILVWDGDERSIASWADGIWIHCSVGMPVVLHPTHWMPLPPPPPASETSCDPTTAKPT